MISPKFIINYITVFSIKVVKLLYFKEILGKISEFSDF